MRISKSNLFLTVIARKRFFCIIGNCLALSYYTKPSGGDANAAIRYIPEKRAIPIGYKKKHIYRV